MKCAWKKVVADGLVSDITSLMIDCMVNSAAYVARVKRGFGADRLMRLIAGSSREMNGVFARIDDSERSDLECVRTSVGSMYAELKGYGVDFCALRDSIQVIDRFGDSWRYESEHKIHDSRERYINLLAVAREPIHASLLICAHNEYQYGAQRMEQLYRDIRADGDLFITEYLECRASADERIRRMLDDRRKALAECGLRIE